MTTFATAQAQYGAVGRTGSLAGIKECSGHRATGSWQHPNKRSGYPPPLMLIVIRNYGQVPPDYR